MLFLSADGRVGGGEEAFDLCGNPHGRVFGGESPLGGRGPGTQRVESFDGQDLLGKDLGEEACGLVGEGFEGGEVVRMGYLPLEAGDGMAGN